MSLRGSKRSTRRAREAREFCVRKRILGFQFRDGFLPKKSLKMFYLVDGMDGMDGTEYQKCPSMFFILCGYIDKVYTYLYR